MRPLTADDVTFVKETGKLGTATYSMDRAYRYDLTRDWDAPLIGNHLKVDGQTFRVVWVGLNPSTATHDVNDATISTCIKYSQSWGAQGLTMLNLFAFRAREPKDMKAADDPVGPLNDATLLHWLDDPLTGLVMCVWGAHGKYRGRAQLVLDLLRKRGRGIPGVLAWNADGSPHHPLYLKKPESPIPMWEE